jgi:hypothetical protein
MLRWPCCKPPVFLESQSHCEPSDDRVQDLRFWNDQHPGSLDQLGLANRLVSILAVVSGLIAFKLVPMRLVRRSIKPFPEVFRHSALCVISVHSKDNVLRCPEQPLEAS